MAFQRIDARPAPQFGENHQVEDKYHQHHRIHMLALSCILVIGLALVGTIAGGPVGTLIGLGVGVGLICLRPILMSLFHYIFPHIHHIFLDWDQKIEKPGPAVGEFVRSDMFIEQDGTKSYEMKLAMLRSAQKSILLSPCFAGGEYWQKALDIIEERLEACPELKVTILVAKDLLMPDDVERMEALKAAHPERFNLLMVGRVAHVEPYLHTTENHTKMLVVDDRYFAVGGSSIDAMGACLEPNKKKAEKQNVLASAFAAAMPAKFRDADAFGRGELAETLRDQFFRLYAIWEYRTTGKKEWRHYTAGEVDTVCQPFEDHPNKCPGVKTKVLVSGPEHRGANPIISELGRMIDGAEEGANVSGLYFLPDPELSAVLERKKAQGIAIDGYFGEDSGRLTPKIIFKVNRRGLEKFERAYLFSDPDYFYHKKVWTVDGKRGGIGSCNLAGKSARCDHEVAIIFESRRIAQQLDQGFRADREKSKQMEMNVEHYGARIFGDVLAVVPGQIII
jgi:phosphatidylserine/phosphatidylglycerophosphate/cardiolipin synthase-like enzyme